MADWMSQQVSDPEGVDEEEAQEQTESATEEPEDEGRTEFERQMRTLLATNSVETLEVSVIEANIDDVTDAKALRKAAEIEERDDALELYEDRLEEVEENPAESPTDESTESGTESSGDTEAETEEEGSDSEADEATEEAEVEGGAEGAEEDVSEEEGEDDGVVNPFEESGESEDTDADADEESESEAAEVPESESDDNTPVAKTDGQGAAVSVKDIAPNAMTVNEAAERDRRWTLMAWAEPGMGKSHFGMSSKSPVCVIDTEGKADELAHKFTDGEFDDPFIFQPSDFDGAKEALEQALTLLDAFRDEHGVYGTIVVDSMSVMWGWSQQKYVDKFYPHADDPSEVDLSTGFGKGKSDWKQIKNYHNVQFRQKMIDSPYHMVWTAMSEDDYDAQINEDNRDAEKAAGEKENVYKVDEVIRIREGSDGAPIGELQKSGKVKHRYTGLRYPNFTKHKNLIEAIDSAEAGSGKSIESIEARFGVTIVEGNPAYANQDDE